MNALNTFLTNLQGILNVASGAAITCAVIVTGYLFFTAHDSVDGMGKAKIMLRNTAIGTLLIIGVNLIIGTLHSIAGVA